jgi:FkbM family methyltransferase
LVPNWKDATFRLCLTGAYGTDLADLLADRSAPFIFIDIGANQGLYSLLAARNPYCQKAIALEPVESTYALLERNIELNRAVDRITALRWAISDREGSALIAYKRNHSGGASLERVCATNTPGEEEIELHQFSELQTYLSNSECPIFIKIDVEGHEPAVIRSLVKAEALHPRATDVFYEVDERWVDVAELQSQLTNIGFREFRNIGDGTHRDIHAVRCKSS